MLQARKQLAPLEQSRRRQEHAAATIEKLVRLLTRLSPGSSPVPSEHGADSPGRVLGLDAPAAPERSRRRELLLGQLRRAVREGAREGAEASLLERAGELLRDADVAGSADAAVARRLQGLLAISDADALGEGLQSAVDGGGGRIGSMSSKVISEIEDHVAEQARREEQEAWLKSELAEALESSDAARLQRLVYKAQALELAVPPEIFALLHELQAAAEGRSSEIFGSPGRPRQDGGRTARQTEFAARRLISVESALAKIEDRPDDNGFKEANRALERAAQAQVPQRELVPWRRRLATLEERHFPRLQVEERLRDALRESRVHGDARVAALRRVLAEAQRCGADEKLVASAREHLSSCHEAAERRRRAELQVRDALALRGQSPGDVAALEDAVESARRVGSRDARAERALAGLRDAQMQREAAQAELREATKSAGPSELARLHEAVKQAKKAGVDAGHIHAAQAFLDELEQHGRRCALAAGNFRRALPTLAREPWRMVELMEAAQRLRPWTPELEKLIQQAQQQLGEASRAEGRRAEAERELRALLRKIRETDQRAPGAVGAVVDGAAGSIAESAAALSDAIGRLRQAGASAESLREAEKLLQTMKRDGCLRVGAEHRLRLAMKNRDLGEIERSVHQVGLLVGMFGGTGVVSLIEIVYEGLA